MLIARPQAATYAAALLLAAISLAIGGTPAAAQDFGEFDEFGGGFDSWMSPMPTRVWAGVDYLLWWRRGIATPPLVTSGDPTNPQAGILDPAVSPDTQILVGNDRLGEKVRPGGRVNIGTWFGPYESLGAEVNFYALGELNTEMQYNSAGNPVLTVPFFNVNTGLEDALQLAALLPAPVFGGINIRTSSDVMGGDLLLRGAVLRDFQFSLDWLAGYQFARIDESLVLNYSLSDGQNEFALLDNFSTQNQFHGGALGLAGSGRRGAWTCSLLTKLGLGNMHEQVIISGQNTVNPGAVTTPGGFFAQATNSGTFTQNSFTVAPEIGLKFGYDINQNARVSFGYNYLYFSQVAQPGDQIDRRINNTQLNGALLVGDAFPAFAFRDNGYELHGITFGIDGRF